ncbi:hypothetical protein [Flavobacteriaceae bacterium 14752]|uniref:hypothetical protein n=1 Tax=Mesohalobacter salilacus TaxID=2491711 RepID=UPI000F63D2F3|nr:hypothetical protein EIG84_05785 [Flavobacteriaceae bacterium 14752]
MKSKIETKGLKGVGNTLLHQSILAEILYALMYKTKTVKKYSRYKVLPEYDIGKVPDVVVLKQTKKSNVPVAYIEICHLKDIDSDLKKLEKLMSKNPNVLNGIVIAFSPNKILFKKLYRLKNRNVSKPKTNSNFDVFNVDISKVLEDVV